jgi:hypothetical protein
MLLELLARYYRYVWMAFAFFALLKIVFSYGFRSALQGPANVIIALFKWYGADEREMQDDGNAQKVMLFLNTLTIFMYVFLGATLAVRLVLFLFR